MKISSAGSGKVAKGEILGGRRDRVAVVFRQAAKVISRRSNRGDALDRVEVLCEKDSRVTDIGSLFQVPDSPPQCWRRLAL